MNAHLEPPLESADRHHKVPPAMEIVLALVLLLAAGLKAIQLFGRSDLIQHSPFHNRLILGGFIEVELLLSAWLAAGGWPRLRFLVALGCFAIFTGVSLGEAARALPSCGCFGNVKVSPLITAAFDAAAVAGLWLTRPRVGHAVDSLPSRNRFAAVAAVAALLSAALWAGYFVKEWGAAADSPTSATGDLVILEPASWVGQQLALIDNIDGGEVLRHGRWLVVLYHSDCDTCRAAVPEYAALAGSDAANRDGERVAFVAMPPLADAADDLASPSERYLHLKLRPDHDWFATTPVVVAIEEGKVVWAAEGEKAAHPPLIHW